MCHQTWTATYIAPWSFQLCPSMRLLDANPCRAGPKSSSTQTEHQAHCLGCENRSRNWTRKSSLPFDPPLESDDDLDDDGKSSASDLEAGGATARAPIIQLATVFVGLTRSGDWAEGQECQQLVLTRTSEIDLSSPVFRDILDEPTKSRFQMSMTAKSLDPSSKCCRKQFRRFRTVETAYFTLFDSQIRIFTL